MTELNAPASFSGSIELTHPEWLWLLLILFLVTLIWRAVAVRKDPASLAMGNINTRHLILHPLISLLPKTRFLHKTSLLRIAVYGLAMTCIVISLTEPVRIGERLPDPPQERDIVFIVDTSIAMILRDYVVDGARIDRMTLLKGVLDRFVQRLSGDRIGIIVFGDEAYTLVPLTRDQALLRRMLSRIQATMVGRFNSVGEAIALAVKQTLQQGAQRSSLQYSQQALRQYLQQDLQQDLQQQTKRHRVLVLLTNVDTPTGSIHPETAAELALEAGLPLYTVAIGATTAEADEARKTGLIYAPVDLTLLKAIAERTGARNYQAGDAHALEQAMTDITQHETNRREQAPRYYREPLYFWPLLMGLALLVLSSLSPMLKSTMLRSASNSSVNIAAQKSVAKTGNVRQ